MALTNGPNLGLLVNGNAGEGHYSELMKQWRGLDALVMPNAKGYLTNTPPGSPSDGDLYIIGAAPTGAWAGQGGKVTRWSSVANAWEFYAPKNGWMIQANSARETYRYTGGAWEIYYQDGALTPVVKPSVRLQWDTILGERAGIQARADAVSVSRTSYDSAFQALATYLNAGTTWSSGTPSWLADANLSTTTTIDGPTFRANWRSLFDARQALLNAITAAAQTAANSAATAAAYADRLARSSHNLIKNGNSETTPQPGTPEADHRAEGAGAARHGSWLRTISNWSGTSRTGLGEWIEWTAPIQCAPGDKFHFEFWARKYSGGVPATSVLNASWRDSSGSEIANTITYLALTTTYQKHSAECVAPAGASFVVFSSGDHNTPNAQELWFDDAYATRKISAGMLEGDAIQSTTSDFKVTSTTASTSTTTGAIVVGGGVGCGDYFTGKYRSSDGSAGLTATRTFYAASSSGGATNVLNTVTIKDGIITSWTQA